MIWLVAHDAGGAELLSSWARRSAPGTVFRFVLAGPAIGVFARKLPTARPEPEEALRSADPRTDWILTGTGSDFERRAIVQARALGVRVASFVDHWVSYPERFTLAGKLCLPDELWVGDADAEALAHRIFPALPLKRVENPYLLEAAGEIAELQRGKLRAAAAPLRILYVCEAFSEHAKRTGGATEGAANLEFRAIRKFADWLERNPPDAGIEAVRFRLHPLEAQDKYDALLGELSAIPAAVSRGRTLAEDCAWCDWMVGVTSMALVVGLAAGKTVISCIPGGELKCTLPQAGIRHL